MSRQTEAERLRECREVFQRSLRDRVPMHEAKRRIALEHVTERRQRIDALRSQPIMTVAAPAEQPEARFFWQQGQYA